MTKHFSHPFSFIYLFIYGLNQVSLSNLVNIETGYRLRNWAQTLGGWDISVTYPVLAGSVLSSTSTTRLLLLGGGGGGRQLEYEVNHLHPSRTKIECVILQYQTCRNCHGIALQHSTNLTSPLFLINKDNIKKEVSPILLEHRILKAYEAVEV